jgi:hypothetical protein
MPRPDCFIQGRRLGTHFKGAVWVPWLIWKAKKISALPPLGYDPLTVQPVQSRYTDWANPCHITLIALHNYTKYEAYFLSGSTEIGIAMLNSFERNEIHIQAYKAVYKPVLINRVLH